MGGLTFSCTDAASPSTQSCDRGVLKRNEGVGRYQIVLLEFRPALSAVGSGDKAFGLYASKPQPVSRVTFIVRYHKANGTSS